MRGLFSKTNNRSITMESALLRLSEAAEFTGLSKDQINHRVIGTTAELPAPGSDRRAQHRLAATRP